MKKEQTGRGSIKEVNLSRPITFNGELITKAIIELDHINYGISKKTKQLNKKRRSSFSLKDIEKFLRLLDDEFVAPFDYKDEWSMFQIRVNCPVRGKFYNKEYLMFFKTNYKDTELIYTITLYPSK